VILLCGPDSVGAAAASELREAVPAVEEDAACYSVVCSHRLCWLSLGPRKDCYAPGQGRSLLVTMETEEDARRRELFELDAGGVQGRLPVCGKSFKR
jgi:hypothetical protein